MKKLLSTILAVSLIITATACSTSGADNRETVDNRETKSTVNPDISEPNQSIASGALIPETTTETTTETQNSGNTYTLRGKDFTLSVHLEDYIYRLDGSDYEYFNLEELMNHYGYADKSGKDILSIRNAYGSDNNSFLFSYKSNSDGTSALSGNPVCGRIDISYTGAYDGYMGVGVLIGAGNQDKVFEINGIVFEGKPSSRWCLTWEQIVLLCVVLDDYTENGTTKNAMDQIEKVVEIGGGGGHGSEVLLNW